MSAGGKRLATLGLPTMVLMEAWVDKPMVPLVISMLDFDAASVLDVQAMAVAVVVVAGVKAATID